MRKRPYRNLFLLALAVLMMVFSLVLSISTGILSETGQASVPVFNRVRSIVNPAIDVIQKNYSKLAQYDDFRALILPELSNARLEMQVVDTGGNLLFDSNKEAGAFENMKVNLARIVHYDMSELKERPGLVTFAFPLIVEDVQKANAVFTLPADSLGDKGQAGSVTVYMPSLLLFLFGMALIMVVFLRIRKDYIKPVRQLNAALPKLIRGNLEASLESSEQNEMGDFIRALDLMRLELKDSLERKNRLETERKELVASISHEIKTPLSSIKAYAEGLRDGLASDPDVMKRYAGVILSKTDGLIKLVNDLMQHALQDLGSLSVNLQEQYSGELLKRILEPLRLKFINTSITLDIDGELPDVLIRADSLRLEQVLVNLIQNAEKYAPEGGRILVGATLEDDCLLISVSDNGMGIPPEELPFIFDRHYRGKKASQSRIEGSGLGLSICKYIIEQHGGTIFAESTSGLGSRFRFTIPKI